jgi:sporulation protein YlmC with PRC-barrel domain
LHTIKDNIIEKSVYTSDGVLIGNIHDIDNDSVVVKSNIISSTGLRII